MSTPAKFPLRPVGATKYFRAIEVEGNDDATNDHSSDNLSRVIASMDQVMRTPTIIAGAIMPDACPTGDVSIPVGGVVVARDAIHPGFHSADICCSVMATQFSRDTCPRKLLDVALSVTHFGRGGRKRSAGVFKYLTKELEDRISSNPFFDSSDLKKAQLHLGTQGDGNHFLSVGRSEGNGSVTLVTHHGSRAFGASLFSKGIEVANRYRQELAIEVDQENAWIPASTEDGKNYWEALQIVRDWTKLNHEVIHGLIANKIGSKTFEGVVPTEATFWNEHNFVFRKFEETTGLNLFFHAKGATPLDDQFVPDSSQGRRLIPLNMAEPILVVNSASSVESLGFAPHGAGRNQTRTAHKKWRRQQTGLTDEGIFAEETKNIDVRFYSGEIDISELPSAYKDANEVQRQIDKFGLGTVVDRIVPYGCIMAGGHGPRKQRPG